MDVVEVVLPRGLPIDGTWQRSVRLRPVDGRDETLLFEQGEALLPAARITTMLARCVESIGSIRPATADHVRALTVGDREALLLELRRLSFGDRLTCVIACPSPGCGEWMDLDLDVSDLLVPPVAEPRTLYEAEVEDDAELYRVWFRLPTGADQEEGAVLARKDPEAAARLVLERCVARVERGQPGEKGPGGEGSVPGARPDLPPAVQRALPGLMADLDPQAELLLELRCPACGTPFTTTFDGADYLFRELAARSRDLFRDVHILALHYHWSEAEILAMSARKRRLYLDLLAETAGSGAR